MESNHQCDVPHSDDNFGTVCFPFKVKLFVVTHYPFDLIFIFQATFFRPSPPFSVLLVAVCRGVTAVDLLLEGPLATTSVSSQVGFQSLSWMSLNPFVSPLSSIGKHSDAPPPPSCPTSNLLKTRHNRQISSQFAGKE